MARRKYDSAVLKFIRQSYDSGLELSRIQALVKDIYGIEISKAYISTLIYVNTDARKWYIHAKKIKNLADIVLNTVPRRQFYRSTSEGEATRKRILEYIIQHPGEYHNMIQRDLDMNLSRVSYHLHRLVAEETVVRVQDGIYVRYFPKGAPIVIPINTVEEKIISLIISNPNITQKPLLEILDLPRPIARYHISRLLAEGKIAKETYGQQVRLKVVEK